MIRRLTSLRRYLLPLLLFLLVLFVCGKLLLTPVNNGPLYNDDTLRLARYGYSPPQDLQVGWPWVFREVTVRGNLPIAVKGPKLQLWILVADIAVVLGICVVAAILIARLQRKLNQDGWRFSLRSLLLLMTLIAAAFGWWAYHKHLADRQKAFRDEIATQGQGPRVTFDDYWYVGPQWLRRLWPDTKLTIFHRPFKLTGARFSTNRELQQLLSHFDHMPYLRSLGISTIQPLHLEDVTPLRHIEHLRIFGLPPEDDTLRRIAEGGSLKTLEIKAEVSDKTIFALEGNREIETLVLSRATQVTDAGAHSLSGFTKLRQLTLQASKITDQGMESLATMTELKSLTIESDYITDQGALQLLKMTSLDRAGISTLHEISFGVKKTLWKRLSNISFLHTK